MSRARRPAGFTLIEMLIAVAVLATALGAIIGNGARFANNAAGLRDKSLALFVARNKMAELELSPNWPATGRSNEDVEMGGVKWTWRTEVKATPDPNLRRVDVRVEKKGDKSGVAFASLSGFLSNVGRQAAP
ncbi:type II secretion system minor pseudopilin GspI [Nevskia sp.]|uniref:type II secretion system minor pseudopilin GspI n=1 Tax=Nevskia sp. TaxID=1929292 RepID=UPI0025DA9DA1|nr:type II secretion system minor pseudopilin GspI [Nevskia sp.]